MRGRRTIGLGLVLLAAAATAPTPARVDVHAPPEANVFPQPPAAPGESCDADGAALARELLGSLSAETDSREAAARAVARELFAAAESPPWSSSGVPSEAASSAVGLLRRADRHGLVPAEYHAEDLRERAATRSGARGCNRAELGAFDLLLTLELARFLTDLHQGRVAHRSSGLGPHADLTAAALAHAMAAAAATGDIDRLLPSAP